MNRPIPASAAEQTQRTWAILYEVDAQWLGHCSLLFAKAAGFGGPAAWEVAIVVRELLSNTLKFAGRGMLTLACLAPPGRGMKIVVEDDGPGIEDLPLALRDGYSEGHLLTEILPKERRGLGAGLGAVGRMMDRLEIENKTGGGLRIIAHKWLRR